MRTHYGLWQPCWISNHKSGRGPSNEHFWQVWLKSVQRFQRRRFKCEKLTDGRTTDAYPWQKLTWPMARWAKNTIQITENQYFVYFKDVLTELFQFNVLLIEICIQYYDHWRLYRTTISQTISIITVGHFSIKKLICRKCEKKYLFSPTHAHYCFS